MSVNYHATYLKLVVHGDDDREVIFSKDDVISYSILKVNIE